MRYLYIFTQRRCDYRPPHTAIDSTIKSFCRAYWFVI